MQLADFGELTFSKLRFYSLGVVAANKLPSSKVIEVTPIEDLPLIDGEITARLDSTTATGVTASGSAYNSGVSSSASISATWLSLSVSNRLTAPDVRRGESVMIYQFSNADKYYWTTVREDVALRRLETVIYGFSGSRVENVDVTQDSMYYFEVSTHLKSITLHTSKADGEPYSYDIQLNTKDGALIIRDDVGNYIHLDSAQRRIELKNTDGSHYDMHQDNLTVTIPSTTKFITTDFNVEASGSCNINASKLFSVSTNTANIKASGSANIKGATANVTAGAMVMIKGGASAVVTSPATSIS
jgi:hypothetical protein